jgi:hypoxanthine phosphoribosyltransferase
VIARRVEELACEVAGNLKKRERPVAVVVLQGAFVFAADLLRALPAGLGIDMGFLRCESYGSGTRSSGRVVLLQDLDASLDLKGRTALLIDDILDTGLTLRYLHKHVKARGARKILTCVLLRRRGRIRSQGIRADFAGFDVGKEFFVGYGLDWAGKHRNLPCLATLELEPGARGGKT